MNKHESCSLCYYRFVFSRFYFIQFVCIHRPHCEDHDSVVVVVVVHIQNNSVLEAGREKNTKSKISCDNVGIYLQNRWFVSVLSAQHLLVPLVDKEKFYAKKREHTHIITT